MSPDAARALLANAELVHSEAAIQNALATLARAVSERLSQRNPLVLCLMNGGLIFCGQLLTRLSFPLQVDYIHATRYGLKTEGGELDWRVSPATPVKGRTVLVVDDILDEGLTLAAVVDGLRAQGAAEVLTAVFADKAHGRPKPIAPDFCGLTVPDRFCFGYGMDVAGAWRHLPAIYAMKEGQ